MKKIGLFSIALLAMGLVSCNQDFETIFEPQTNAPESPLQASDVTVAASSATAINLADFIDEEAGTSTPIPVGTISVKEGAMPANTTLKAEVEFSTDPDFGEVITLEGNINERNEITVDPTVLQDKYFNEVTRNPASTTLYMRALLYTVTDGTSVAIVGNPKESKFAARSVTFSPLFKVQISPAYYVIGAAGGWSADGARTQKFSHSNKDVYEDPIFSIVVDTGGDDCWFAIGDDAALDAVASGDWTKLFGTKGASEDMEGNMDFRYNLGGDHSFHVLGAQKIRITLNMMEYSYKIDPISVADAYYVVGGLQGWSDSQKTCLFTPEEQKNVLSYTTKWTGAWDLKVWDANSFGNWDAAWGCVVDGDNSPSGALINSGAQAISAPSAEFYTFTIDMNTMTYTWTKLDNQNPTEYEHISLIGEFNGWGGDFELTQVTPHNWYAVFTQETDGQLKFRANHDWGVNWGYGNDKDWDVSESFNKIGTNGGGNIWVPAGTYAVYLNDITNSMLILAQ